MTGFIFFIHIIICVLLTCIILMQSGRGGGLTEAFSQAGEMFGARTNELLIRTTTIMACIFFVTCLTLAILSSKKGKSLMATQSYSPTQSVPQQTKAIESLLEKAQEKAEEKSQEQINGEVKTLVPPQQTESLPEKVQTQLKTTEPLETVETTPVESVPVDSQKLPEPVEAVNP